MSNLRDIIITVAGLILVGLAVFLMQRPKETITHEIPVVIDFTTPEVLKAHDTVYIDSIVYKDRVIYKEHSYNKELKKQYMAAKDSIAKLNLYLEAITEREYKITYPDSIQNITVFTRARGELLKQQVSYEVFPKTHYIDTTVSVVQKPRIKVWGRVALGVPLYNPEYNKPVLGEIGLIIKNRNDGIMTFDIDTQIRGWVGFAKKF